MGQDKSFQLRILEKVLRFMAVLVLRKYKPKVIGITGSVGKSSTKEAVHAVLSSHFPTRKSEKNYNNEVGLPLAIIGAESGESSLIGWLKVGLSWISVILFPHHYPKILVLEMGADRPGDMKYLTEFIKPEIGIITDISGSHLEYFKSIEGVAKEKSILVKKLDNEGLAVLNIDNLLIKKLKTKLKTKAISFGFSAEADIQASDIFYSYSDENQYEKIRGISFKLLHKGTTIPIRLNNVLAQHQIYPALAAIACGLELGINLVEIAKNLENFSPPSGRMCLVEGIKNSVIIDDTYNASPVSTEAALQTIGNIKAKRKIIVLGDMLELGKNTITAHQAVAESFIKIKGDIFIGVGDRMKFAIDELSQRKIGQDRVWWFKNPMEAGKQLERIIKEEDLVLVKGSQGMRMEKVVEEVIAHPEEAAELLCRQNKAWKEKPWKEV